MRYDTIKSILNDSKYEMTAAFESGFDRSSVFIDTFVEISERFEKIGMKKGADLSKKLSIQFSIPEKDLTNTARLFAQLWTYINSCEDRVCYLQTIDALNVDKDDIESEDLEEEY